MGECISYSDILEDFESRYPHLISKIVEGYQEGANKIRLWFDDGSQMVYDFRKKKGRMIKHDFSDEIRKSDKRREE